MSLYSEFKKFCNKLTHNFVKTYIFIFSKFSSDTLQELMFVCFRASLLWILSSLLILIFFKVKNNLIVSIPLKSASLSDRSNIKLVFKFWVVIYLATIIDMLLKLIVRISFAQEHLLFNIMFKYKKLLKHHAVKISLGCKKSEFRLLSLISYIR